MWRWWPAFGVVSGRLRGGRMWTGLRNLEAVGRCCAPTADGARARTFVALVASMARNRGGGVVMVAVLQVEVEELWCRAPPAIILASTLLPYVPSRGRGL